jgi:type 1 fimbria pilin
LKGNYLMKKNIAVLVGMFLAVAGLSAQAADLRVKGTIAPSSCSFTITNSVIDYGAINPSTLSPTNYTKLATKTTPYAIRCSSGVKTKVGIKAVDNRASSRIPNLMVSQIGGSYTDTYNYGLGTTARAQKIGGYVVHLRNSVADGRAVNVLTSINNGTSWVQGGPALGQGANIAAWHTGTNTPIQLNTLAGNLEIQAVINKTSELDMTSQIALDGQATLELRYL